MDGVDGDLVCVAARDETHDVRSLVLRAPGGGLRFDPGQYLTLTADVGGVPVSRCYSISSSPHRPEEVTVTVKRVPGGPLSNHLHDHVRPGDTVRATGPLGTFSTAHHPAGRVLLLSAGSGITPVVSMARTLHGSADVAFVHSARTPADLAFREELEALAATDPAFALTLVCGSDPTGTWTGPRGRLTADVLRAAVPDVAEREVFVCGPAGYREAVRGMLDGLGADPDRCHEESYVLGPPATTGVDTGTAPTAAGAPASPAPAAGRTFRVELARSGRVLDCPDGTTVLEALATAGVVWPSSCAEGMCGTCKTTLVGGSVDMDHQGGIRPREVADGKILPCCSTPREDLVLDA
ncbi:hybrid-cluster NAD(P)-dependent oxidoreductase [Phycicoccus sp. CMS6Z-2]|nr:hybrid-cluster NAD(P)-dependent oxidoreductase [Phycicoccus flavus]